MSTSQNNHQVVQQQLVKDKKVILASDKYQANDFVWMDQFVISTSGQLLTGYGQEDDNNCFIVELSLIMLQLVLFWLKINSLLMLVKQSWQQLTFKSVIEA